MKKISVTTKIKIPLYLFLICLGIGFPLASSPAFFILPDTDRSFQWSDEPDFEKYLCGQVAQRVFGKNPADTKDCISLREQSLTDALFSFAQGDFTKEKQVAFYQEEGKQLLPVWLEPSKGEEFILINFVITKEKQLFIQCLRKKDKQFMYFRTKRENWK